MLEYALALVLQVEEEVGRLVRLVDEKAFDEGAVKKVIARLKRWMKTRKKFKVNKFVESLPEELVGAVDQAYLTDLGELSKNSDKLTDELTKILKELKKQKVKEKMKQLSEEIRLAEKENKNKKLKKLQEEFVEVSKGFKL